MARWRGTTMTVCLDGGFGDAGQNLRLCDGRRCRCRRCAGDGVRRQGRPGAPGPGGERGPVSFDILVFSAPVPVTVQDARQVAESAEDPPPGTEPDPRIAAFCQDLLARFPALESFTDEDF